MDLLLISWTILGKDDFIGLYNIDNLYYVHGVLISCCGADFKCLYPSYTINYVLCTEVDI